MVVPLAADATMLGSSSAIAGVTMIVGPVGAGSASRQLTEGSGPASRPPPPASSPLPPSSRVPPPSSRPPPPSRSPPPPSGVVPPSSSPQPSSAKSAIERTHECVRIPPSQRATLPQFAYPRGRRFPHDSSLAASLGGPRPRRDRVRVQPRWSRIGRDGDHAPGAGRL